jgi:chorismate mutase / prephenate dehydratase
MSLDELRKRVDALDGELVRLLNERTKLAMEIGALKKRDGQEAYVPQRERMVLDRVTELNRGPLPAASLQAVFREIMSASLALERDMVVAYFGPAGTFTHQAARARFGGSVRYKDCATITDVFTAVEKRTADYGVVPIENSTEGAVTHTLDQFVDTPLRICAEVSLPIAHHLVGVAADRAAVCRVYSHPQVFGQCRRWLMENLPKAELVPVSSTSKAAEMAAADPTSAALAGELAAELHGLTRLESDVQDIGGNMTRFLVLGKEYGGPSGNDKTSVLFAVKHRAGALYQALESFKKHDINMTKIESRPSKAKAWEYYFFVDLAAHADDPPVSRALAELSEHCLLMTVLGSYPAAPGAQA